MEKTDSVWSSQRSVSDNRAGKTIVLNEVEEMKLMTRIHIAVVDCFERRRLYKLYRTFQSTGTNVHIRKNPMISSPGQLTIGSNVWIGDNFYAASQGGITIGSGTIISRNVEIWTGNHNYDSPDLMMIPYDRRMVCRPVEIGENVWIGSRVIILPGVRIGEGVVIGAGAVVAKDVPPCAVIGGNPAKVLKYRDKEQYMALKKQGRVYLDMEYDYDRSSLRKSEYLRYGK